MFDVTKLREYSPSTLALVFAAIYTAKYLGKPKLKYFEPTEFGVWYPLLDNELLTKLDSLRGLWGYPIMISPEAGAIGRIGAGSQHDIDFTGTVRAIDVMPLVKTLYGAEYRGLNKSELKQFYDLAAKVGFRGIGVYPQWSLHPGFHLDTRLEPKNSPFDNWSAKYVTQVNAAGQKQLVQVYVGVNEAFA